MNRLTFPIPFPIPQPISMPSIATRFLRFTILSAGQVSYLVEGKRYEPVPHSILLLAPGTFHGVKVESSQEYERYALHFEKENTQPEREEMLLAPFFGGVSGRKDIYYQGADGFSMAEYFDAMLECEASGLQGKLLPIRLESLLSQIVRMDLLGHTAEADVRSGTTDQIIRYLNRSLCEPVTLDSLSERFFPQQKPPQLAVQAGDRYDSPATI